jgi:hypothetical protein
MRVRLLAYICAPLIVAALLSSVPARAQSPAGKGKASPDKKWRTPWGDADLQGSWSNTNMTPLERPAKWAGKELMTEQERAEEEKKRAREEGGSYYDNAWTDGRTSLIYDPPNGKMPPPTPEGEVRQAQLKKSFERARNNGPYDGPEDMEIRTRCIIRDPLPRIPANYGNSYEIVQAPGTVAIFHEAIHETRVIPLDRRPHLDASVRQWFGDARGHWEGDTLVVETTNFNDQTGFLGSTKNLHLVERWTRVADDRIDYTFTVSDPETWTKPWSASIPWHTAGPVYEYACHEDNIDMYGILTGARANDQKSAGAPPKNPGK